MGHRRTFTRGGRQVRETLWIGIGTVEAALTGAPTAVILNALNAAALALRPFTVIRTRMVMFGRSDQVIAGESWGVDVAGVVVSEQASAIGVTAVPTPATDVGSDLFFMYEQIFGRFQFLDSTGAVNMGVFKQIDSKAMRRVNEDQDVLIVAENEVNGVQLITSGRILVKLH